MRAAKQDAFESIHALWRARAVAYDANAEETRWLLDAGHAGGCEAAFEADVQALTDARIDADLVDLTSQPTYEQLARLGGLRAGSRG